MKNVRTTIFVFSILSLLSSVAIMMFTMFSALVSSFWLSFFQISLDDLGSLTSLLFGIEIKYFFLSFAYLFLGFFFNILKDKKQYVSLFLLGISVWFILKDSMSIINWIKINEMEAFGVYFTFVFWVPILFVLFFILAFIIPQILIYRKVKIRSNIKVAEQG